MKPYWIKQEGVKLAISADTAFRIIEEARGCPVPDTPEQRQWVERFAASSGASRYPRGIFMTSYFCWVPGPQRGPKSRPAAARQNRRQSRRNRRTSPVFVYAFSWAPDQASHGNAAFGNDDFFAKSHAAEESGEMRFCFAGVHYFHETMLDQACGLSLVEILPPPSTVFPGAEIALLATRPKTAVTIFPARVSRFIAFCLS
jgi:hypothetical protein